jgi:hypothetical protein
MRRRDTWSTIPVRPIRGNVSQGQLELNQKRKADAANLPADTEVMVRLSESGPEIQCQLSYHARADDEAVFLEADWEAAGWPKDASNLASIQLKQRTKANIVRNAISLRFIAVIGPILVAACAIGPGLIWPPPSTATSASQVVGASQLARVLAATPHLSRPAMADVAALRAELRAAQATDTSTQAQQHRYNVAYLVYAILVLLLAIAVTVPQARGVLGIRSRKTPSAE